MKTIEFNFEVYTNLGFKFVSVFAHHIDEAALLIGTYVKDVTFFALNFQMENNDFKVGTIIG